MLGVELQPRTQFRYLGVVIDQGFTWIAHLKYIKAKSERVIMTLSRICGRTFGYSYKARKIMYDSCVVTLFHYCSSVFYRRLALASNQKILEATDRKANIGISAAYRTIHIRGIIDKARKYLPQYFWL